MTRPRLAAFLAASFLLWAWSQPGRAQLPDECTNADQERAATFTVRAVQALMKDGDLEKLGRAVGEMESGLSKPCRAALDRAQPVRVRCNDEERKVVLRQMNELMRAIAMENFDAAFQAMYALEARVSRSCWLAVNQATDPRVRAACSPTELDAMASFASPALRVTQRALRTGDPSEMLQIVVDMSAKVSQQCWGSLIQAQNHPQPTPQPRPSPVKPPGLVIDHGGGAFSATGIGYCSPNGCIAY